MTDASKWQTHVAALNCLGYLCVCAAEQVILLMYKIVPKVAAMMWEMKQEVKDAGKQCMMDICGCIDNMDLESFVPGLISMICNPTEEVEECVHLLAATTFVQTVNSAALSIVVPVLVRGFMAKGTATKRLCAVIVENMAKLVDEPNDVEPLLGQVYDDVKAASNNISDPECRTICLRALALLDKIKGQMAANPRKILYYESTLPKVAAAVGATDAFTTQAVEYAAEITVSMANCRKFDEAIWIDTYVNIVSSFVGVDKATQAAKAQMVSCNAISSVS